MPQQMALETTNQKSLIETSLWQAWVWVAWIERGQQIWAQKIYAEESFESISDSQLKTSTLTMFGLDRDSQLNNSPLPILWSLRERLC